MLKVIFALVLGVVIGYVLTPFIKLEDKILSTNEIAQKLSSTDHANMTMGEMLDSLKGKEGDDFDKTFLESMIVHHEGAVEMAEVAQKVSQRQEIKDLADSIIYSQTIEINEMNEWKNDWGYLHADH